MHVHLLHLRHKRPSNAACTDAAVPVYVDRDAHPNDLDAQGAGNKPSGLRSNHRVRDRSCKRALQDGPIDLQPVGHRCRPRCRRVLLFSIGTPSLPTGVTTILAAPELPAGLLVAMVVISEQARQPLRPTNTQVRPTFPALKLDLPSNLSIEQAFNWANVKLNRPATLRSQF